MPASAGSREAALKRCGELEQALLATLVFPARVGLLLLPSVTSRVGQMACARLINSDEQSG
jgi:hypothetical protein